MSRHKAYVKRTAIFAIDCAAVLVGLLIAAPFVLTLTSPLWVGF